MLWKKDKELKLSIGKWSIRSIKNNKETIKDLYDKAIREEERKANNKYEKVVSRCQSLSESLADLKLNIKFSECIYVLDKSVRQRMFKKSGTTQNEWEKLKYLYETKLIKFLDNEEIKENMNSTNEIKRLRKERNEILERY